MFIHVLGHKWLATDGLFENRPPRPAHKQGKKGKHREAFIKRGTHTQLKVGGSKPERPR